MFILFFVSSQLKAQENNIGSDSSSIKQQILEFNSDYWKAYNACDVEKILSMESEDIEFYHDRGGLTIGQSESKKVWENFCKKKEWKLEAILMDDIKVYELKDSGNLYAAIIIGELSFHAIRLSDGEKFPAGFSSYTTVLNYENGEWRMSRALSYNHRDSR
ncbi:nuclear transport factor 2 family protein [Algoriphagus halophilus]|uniref:YybH family protein n=1 Tax=Algoriphagus halophilus TaxID=226505 RepID=UPI00358E6944